MKIIMRKTVLALLFTVSPVCAYARDFTVCVFEKGTGDPIDGATVVVPNTDDYVTTDATGCSTMSGIESGTQLKALAPGYETLVSTVRGQRGIITLYIVPASFDVAGMEVHAERLPEKISKIGLSAAELAHVTGNQGDPIMAAQSLPGVVAAEDGGALVYMRGSDTNDNIAVANRIPIGYLYHFGGQRSTINPRLIGDLNIFTGGFPVAYGDSLGGVFDVKLRDPADRKRKYYFDISTIESSFVVEGPVSSAAPRDSYYLAARRSYIDLLISPSKFTDLSSNDKKTEEETNQFITVPSYYDVQAAYHHPTDNGSVDYYYFASGDDLSFENRQGVKADPQAAGELKSSQGYQTLAMAWRANLSDKWKIDMPVAIYNNSEKFKFGTDDQGDSFFADTEQNSITWSPQLTWRHDRNDELIFGLDAGYFDVPLDIYSSRPPLEEDVDFEITDLPKYRFRDTLVARSFAGYLHERKHWTDRLTTTAGLRYSSVTGSGGIRMDDASPRVSLEYQATTSTLYTASWGRYLQLPLGFELFDGFGNPSLGFTEAEHRIVGVEHKIDPLWSIKAELYHKPMDNLVVAVDSESPPDNYRNLGEGEAYGLDVYLKRELRDGRMGWISYSYGRSNRTNPLKPEVGERRFSGDQPHTLTAVWSQPFSYGPFGWLKDWKNWTWGVKLQAHSGTVYTPVESVSTSTNPDGSVRSVAEYGAHNSRRTPVYYRLDLRLERAILSDESKMKFYIDIMNVTNHNNVTGYDYGEGFENLDNPDEITGMPFFPYIGFEKEF